MLSALSVGLFVHLLAALVLACGNAAALAATIWARRTSDPATSLTLMRMHRGVVNVLVIPDALAVLASGIYLAYAAGVSLSVGWMLASFVVWALALAIGIAILVPEQDPAIREAERLVEHAAGETSAELRRHVAARRIVLGEWSQQLLIVVFLYLMVFKPGS